MDPAVREGGDEGKPIVQSHPDSPVAVALREITEDISLKVSLAALKQQTQPISIVFK
jgi:hypothetical protein